jgi:tetratricopeptide (TPR) repeat protein
MSSSLRLQSKTVEPIEDRIDSLFRELELSSKWQRPSILFAIYSSEYIHTEAESNLENKLNELDQKVIRILIENEDNSDITTRLSEYSSNENTVFFISGLRWGCNKGSNLYLDLNNQREFFVENRVRLVFWLTEKEVIDLANHAPDFWAFRHRVIEFIDSPRPEQILQSAAEATWQGTGEYTDPVEDIDAKISFRESLLTNLPIGNESASVNGSLLLTLGILHWRKGDYEKASEFLKTALEIAISIKDKWFAAECFNAIALVKTGLGRTDEAIEAYQRAIHLAPNQIFPWNNLGILFSKLERNEDAVVAFKKAIENKPGDAVSWNGLGEVYLKLDRTDDAIRAYLKAIEFAPNFAAAWCGLGSAFTSAKKTEYAVKAYQKAFSLNNRLTPSIIGLARILTGQGREDKAIQAYEAALNIDPKNANGWNELGNLCLNSGAHDKAILAFGKAVELSPKSGIFFSNQAMAYLEKGVHLEAIPLFEKSLNLLENNEDKALSWNRLGNAYRQIGDYNRAVSAYQLADEYRGIPGTTIPNTTFELNSENETTNQTENESITNSEPENPGDVIQVSSYLESKESRVDPVSAESSNPITLNIESEEFAQVLDGDNLSLLDKTISEIEEMVSKNNSLDSEGGVNQSELVDVADDDSENNIDDDRMNALEWNELGNVHLKSGSYDDAIIAYTKAIEMAPEFNWPYIKNLAIAYYHKGKQREDASLDESEDSDNEDNLIDNQGLNSIQELHDLSSEIFNKPLKDNEPEPESTVAQALPDEEYTLDESSVIEPLSFDPNMIGKDLLQEALQEDMEFSTGKLRDGIPASRELVENRFTGELNKFKVMEPENAQVDINPGRDKFEVQPKSAYEWNELGNIYLKIGSNDKASDAFKKAIELDPYFGWAYSNLALSYNHSKKFNESIPLYKKSIDLLDTDKGKAISWNRLGDVYRHLNDQENAMKAYQMASDLDGDTKPILARARMVLLNNA